MLALGDVMVDPFPFGGGVTTLEALAVCTPVVTLPALQNVPALTAGMLRTLSLASSAGENGEIHRRNIFPTVEAFIEGARILLSDAAANAEMRTAICRDADSLFASSSTPTGAVAEWAELLATASTPSEAEVVLGTEVDKTERTDEE